MDTFISLDHGSGGLASQNLISGLFLKHLTSPQLRDLEDCAVLGEYAGRIALSTDSYVVDPLFFPGGDIGALAVHGTINDLAMRGARPLALSLALIIEEGFSLASLERIIASVARASEAAGVAIVTGDTKVVPRGKGDKIFITTSGIGVFAHALEIGGGGARAGDKLLINGPIGDHGLAVLAGREGLELETDIRSDSAPLNHLVGALLDEFGDAVHVLRDPTRGGVATTLKEIARQSQVRIELDEKALPVHPAVVGACALLGLDPLFVANEGKLLALVAPAAADALLERMRRHPQGQGAALIGEVTAESPGQVQLHTAIGGRRAIEMLAGEQLPRIC